MIETKQGNHVQAQFNRVHISSKDFEEALEYLDHFEKGNPSPVNRALLVAAIMTYSRPFTNNRDDPEAAGKLPINPKKAVNASDLLLHEKILNLRNEAVAHSGYRRNRSNRTSSVGNSFAIEYERFDPLMEEMNVEQFKSLVISMKRYCVSKLNQLNEKF